MLLGLAPAEQRARDFPDPFVLRGSDAFYAFATGTGGMHVQVARSRDLAAWKLVADALPQLPTWAAEGEGLTWAPAVLARGQRFVLYYTARHAASGYQCISRAVSTSAPGPYRDDSAQPFVCPVGGSEQLCGSIDPSPFVDASGRAYLLWKSDENSPSCHAPPRLWSQSLSDDGLELRGSPRALLRMDRDWEQPIVEGPSMLLHDGAYFLFYSANWYDSARYAIGYAKCAGPLGPCSKVTTDAPLLGSGGGALGPGGQELFADARGEPWIAYHAWTAPRASYAAGGARSLRLARVTFAGGAPVIEAGGSSAPLVLE
jgi:beta-xylosidase